MTLSDALNAATAVVLSLGGGGAIVLALSGWLGKVWAARILEHDRRRYGEELERVKNEFERSRRELQASLDKTIFVHRVHFETEFKVLSELWEKLVAVRLGIWNLRPILESGREEMTEEERQREFWKRAQSLHASWEAARDVRDRWSPFYPREIHQQVVNALAPLMEDFWTILTSKDPFARTVLERGLRIRTEVMSKIDEIGEAIRSRLEQLAVHKAN